MKGIVFHVNADGKHGWAVHTSDQSLLCRWGYYLNEVDIPALPNCTNNTSALSDTAGYANTRAIRAAGNATIYEAAYLVDFPRGWYIPAIGQLMRLYACMDEVNTSLGVVGGTAFVFNTTQWYYWSSSEFSYESAWVLEIRGFQAIGYKHPQDGGRLRAVCSF